MIDILFQIKEKLRQKKRHKAERWMLYIVLVKESIAQKKTSILKAIITIIIIVSQHNHQHPFCFLSELLSFFPLVNLSHTNPNVKIKIKLIHLWLDDFTDKYQQIL